jgi:hypothetical protein
MILIFNNWNIEKARRSNEGGIDVTCIDDVGLRMFFYSSGTIQIIKDFVSKRYK